MPASIAMSNCFSPGHAANTGKKSWRSQALLGRCTRCSLPQMRHGVLKHPGDSAGHMGESLPGESRQLGGQR